MKGSSGIDHGHNDVDSDEKEEGTDIEVDEEALLPAPPPFTKRYVRMARKS